MREYPTVQYPTILAGKIWGHKLRLESLDGSEIISEVDSDYGYIDLKNYAPIEINGKTYGVTHLQKQSSRGWLKVSPQSYHWWWFWKPQEKDKNGNWMPGTERGIYFRRPFGWRWDIAGTMIEGIVRHWIWTKGFLGTHWD